MFASSEMFWQAYTRLGEAQILLPAALAVYGWTVWRAPAARVCASRWLLCVALAAGLTTLTKVAFIGYGLGSARWDFTGLSGHAMFAAAILPVLMRLLVVDQGPTRVRWAVAGGYALAMLVAVSRVKVDAHSVSEVVGGALCGGTASAIALAMWRHLPLLRVGRKRVELLARQSLDQRFHLFLPPLWQRRDQPIRQLAVLGIVHRPNAFSGNIGLNQQMRHRCAAQANRSGIDR